MKLVKDLQKWIDGYNEVKTLADELELAFDFYKEELVTEEDVDAAYAKASEAVEALELKNMLRDEADQMDCVLKINSGAGGTESQDWASMLMRMYLRYAETHGYKATISNDQLRQAFLSWNGITDLIARIVDAMYTGANYDEFITMKYLLAKHLIAGNIYANQIDTVSTDNMKSIVATIKGVSNSLEFLSNKYNYNGVETYTNKSDQYILINAKFDATMDVEVLASAFNMDKAEFMGRRVLVDSFGNLDNARLKLLFAEDPNYTEISEDDLQALDNIPAVMVDRYFFMIFDNFYNFTEQYNGEGLYWNYWYHTWKTFSISPFHNAVAFVPGAPTITSVTVEPSTASGSVGSTIQLSAEVVSTNFAPKTVTWSSSSENVTVNSNGLVTIGTGASGSVTITATSTYDTKKSGTCTITIS